MSSPLNASQRVALDWHLSEYDRTGTFEDILDAVWNTHGTYTVWEPMEPYDGVQLCEWIETLESEVADVIKGATL